MASFTTTTYLFSANDRFYENLELLLSFVERPAFRPEKVEKERFGMVYAIVTRDYAFADKASAREHFTRMTGLFKNLNYAAPGSNDEERLKGEIEALDRSVPMISGSEGSDDEANESETAA